MASCAARLISAGAAKSGKPWERFTALYFSASRVISRITDSVNCAALEDKRSLVAMARSVLAGFILRLRSVKSVINGCVAGDDLHVFPRFGERNRIYKLRNFAVVLPFVPLRDAIFTRIVRGQRRFHTSEILFQAGEIERAESHVVIRVDQPARRITHLCAASKFACCFRKQLHKPVGVGYRTSIRIERRFL